jgi:hypothetical protein
MSDDHKLVASPEQHELPERMHPLVAMAMRGGTLDPSTLRELLAVQREYEAGEARKNFTRALTALKRDLPTVIARDKIVDFAGKTGARTRYTHSSLAQVIDAVTAPLTAHGFSLAWEPRRLERGDVEVTARLTHAEGHSESCTLSAPVDTSGSKSPAQSVASTVTLLSRYTALSLLGIATADQQEPGPIEPPARDGTHVDSARNLRAVERLSKLGLSRADAERHVGRPVSEWTAGDIQRLATWARGEVAADDEPREPGVD